MNSLDCILNFKTFLEAIIIGIITFVIGKICFNMTINKNNSKDEENKIPYGLDLTFFITGFFLHFIIEIIGLNKWYCDKKCLSGIINLTKL
jgi:uncharacterized membrane protein